MNSYQLQAVLSDDSIRAIPLNNYDLVAIDKLTNQYGEFTFQSILEQQGYIERTDEIKKFQISVKGKPYPYSVVFNNPYLVPVLNDLTTDDGKHYRVNPQNPALKEMQRFLFQRLEEDKHHFFDDYRYSNPLSRKINQYLQTPDDGTIEEQNQRNQLRNEILSEVTRYKTYRSLCIYRKWYELKQEHSNRWPQNPTQIPNKSKNNQRNHQQTRVTNLRIGQTTERYLENYVLKEDKSFKYEFQAYTNNDGEEREEFLEESEIKEMRKC